MHCRRRTSMHCLLSSFPFGSFVTRPTIRLSRNEHIDLRPSLEVLKLCAPLSSRFYCSRSRFSSPRFLVLRPTGHQPPCGRFILFPSLRAILRLASWVLPCSHTGSRLVPLSRGLKRELVQWQRSRLSIRVTGKTVWTLCAAARVVRIR